MGENSITLAYGLERLRDRVEGIESEAALQLIAETLILHRKWLRAHIKG